MQNAIAFVHNDVITVAWSYGKTLDHCMGFAVYRIDPKGKETALPAVAAFPGVQRMVEALSGFVARAKKGGPLYAATGTDTVVSKIAVTDQTTVQTVPFSLLHARLFGTRPAYAYATMGIGLNANNGSKQVEYFVGLSLGIKNLFVSGGVHYGRVQALTGGFQVDDIVGDKVSAPVSWRYVGRPALSLSYKLPLP